MTENEQKYDVMWTPWGVANEVTKLATGVYWVTTSWRGGVLVDREVAVKLLTPEGRALGQEWKNWLAYAEDFDWAVVAYEHPELTAPISASHPGNVFEEQRQAFECLSRWHPGYLMDCGIVPDMEILRQSVDNGNPAYATEARANLARAEALIEEMEAKRAAVRRGRSRRGRQGGKS